MKTEPTIVSNFHPNSGFIDEMLLELPIKIPTAVKEIVSPYAIHLHAAAQKGDLTALKTLLDEVRLKLQPLQHSAGDVNFFLKELLIEHENSANYNRTLLAEACVNGQLPLVEFLLQEFHAKLLVTDTFKWHAMPIHLAAYYGHRDVVEYFLTIKPDLLETRCKIQDTALTMAAAGGHVELVEMLLTSKPAHANVEERGELGRTALHKAAEAGHLHVVRYLVEKAKATVNLRDFGSTKSMPIHAAAQRGHLEIVDFLLSVKPDLLEARNKFNDTPLCLAAENGHLAIVKFLVREKGADIEARGFLGRTPLIKAASQGHYLIIRFLLEKVKANIYAKDFAMDDMAVHFAASNGYTEIVAYLLRRKPDLLDPRNKKGMTPLAYARQHKRTEVIALLQGIREAIS